jgi:hypothetical protein
MLLLLFVCCCCFGFVHLHERTQDNSTDSGGEDGHVENQQLEFVKAFTEEDHNRTKQQQQPQQQQDQQKQQQQQQQTATPLRGKEAVANLHFFKALTEDTQKHEQVLSSSPPPSIFISSDSITQMSGSPSQGAEKRVSTMTVVVCFVVFSSLTLFDDFQRSSSHHGGAVGSHIAKHKQANSAAAAAAAEANKRSSRASLPADVAVQTPKDDSGYTYTRITAEAYPDSNRGPKESGGGEGDDGETAQPGMNLAFLQAFQEQNNVVEPEEPQNNNNNNNNNNNKDDNAPPPSINNLAFFKQLQNDIQHNSPAPSRPAHAASMPPLNNNNNMNNGAGGIVESPIAKLAFFRTLQEDQQRAQGNNNAAVGEWEANFPPTSTDPVVAPVITQIKDDKRPLPEGPVKRALPPGPRVLPPGPPVKK